MLSQGLSQTDSAAPPRAVPGKHCAPAGTLCLANSSDQMLKITDKGGFWESRKAAATFHQAPLAVAAAHWSRTHSDHRGHCPACISLPWPGAGSRTPTSGPTPAPPRAQPSPVGGKCLQGQGSLPTEAWPSSGGAHCGLCHAGATVIFLRNSTTHAIRCCPDCLINTRSFMLQGCLVPLQRTLRPVPCGPPITASHLLYWLGDN